MKNLYITAFFLLLSLKAMGQETANPKTGKIIDPKTEKIPVETKLLPKKAFNKMVTQDITYTIFGESSPVSGIKLDISKPEVTISGVFQSKNKPWILTGLEFKGGLTGKSASIYKGRNNFNTAFEFVPSIHIIPRLNKAKYYKYKQPVLVAKNKLISLETIKIEDSLLVATVIYNRHLIDFPDLHDTSKKLPSTGANTPPQMSILRYLVKQVLKNQSLNLDSASFDYILSLVPKADAGNMDSTYIDSIVENYKKYFKRYDNSEEEEMAKQIANVSTAWSQKKYWWFTISPFIGTEKITEYHTELKGVDSLYFKSNNPVHYGINAMINRYRVWPNTVALYFKAGFGLSYANNLTTLRSFDYETTSPFFSHGSSVTTTKKTGTAYNYSEIKSDLISQFSGDIYILPLKPLIPGVYFSGTIKSSDIYNLPKIEDREGDKVIVPIETGLIFNITSRDNAKNLISISLYYRHEDITDKRQVTKFDGVEESRDDFLDRNRSYGVKIGIPITLPQKSN